MGATQEVLLKKWNDFLRTRGYTAAIAEICDNYPEQQSLYVPYPEILVYDEELAQDLLEKPARVIPAGETAILRLVPQDAVDHIQELGQKLEVNLRVKELPALLTRVEIRDLRLHHLNRFISIKGLVKNTVQVRPRLHIGAFRCLRCGHVTFEEQGRMEFREPTQCASCQKTAGTTRFRLSPEDSIFIDTQRIEVQESPEDLRGGEQPQRLTTYLEKEITGTINPGNKVILNGVLMATPPRNQRAHPTTFNIYLDVNGIELEEKDFEDVEITDEEVQRIKELARDPELNAKMTASIAPTIYGMKMEKEVLALQLFGGVPKVAPDGTRIRGDIHVLLVGDPGTAKSQILVYLAHLSPRGIYASGQAATKAGLTAAAVPDEMGDGRWKLEAGALVLADKGMACIDEIDKMEAEDRSSMHEAMAQQTISVAKAGITATLQARTSILAAANPKHGRFDKFKTIIEQIDLPLPLITRFDVIFPLADKPDPETDGALARHILKATLVAERIARARALGETGEIEGVEAIKPPIEPEFMRKYLAYARRNIFPTLTPEAMERIKDYFVMMRMSYSGEGVAITARQLESIVRIAEASARVRLADTVEESDAKRAIDILENYLRRVAMSEEGTIDIDIITTGVPRTRVEKQGKLYSMIQDAGPDGIPWDTLVLEAGGTGIERKELEMLLYNLKEEGTVYEPKAGIYRTTRA
ncbi:MAG: minichromosome maintenance protein MCM [Thermoplasmata archaeon]|nr:minichromosome maintenance protein MCM [Thermoplasmata archaeon]